MGHFELYRDNKQSNFSLPLDWELIYHTEQTNLIYINYTMTV